MARTFRRDGAASGDPAELPGRTRPVSAPNLDDISLKLMMIFRQTFLVATQRDFCYEASHEVGTRKPILSPERGRK